MTTQQDSVDVERLRVVVRNVLYRSRLNGSSADVYDTADEIVAALAVPINKIGEDARTYADGVEDAARYVEGHGGVIPGATAFIPMVTGDRQPCMSGDGRDRLMPARRREFDDATRSLASAIRRLSTSTDKGVSNGR